jgi:predicted phage gp36 major capsid-like protein
LAKARRPVGSSRRTPSSIESKIVSRTSRSSLDDRSVAWSEPLASRISACMRVTRFLLVARTAALPAAAPIAAAPAAIPATSSASAIWPECTSVSQHFIGRSPSLR